MFFSSRNLCVVDLPEWDGPALYKNFIRIYELLKTFKGLTIWIRDGNFCVGLGENISKSFFSKMFYKQL
jgi:hypothetical protein